MVSFYSIFQVYFIMVNFLFILNSLYSIFVAKSITHIILLVKWILVSWLIYTEITICGLMMELSHSLTLNEDALKEIPEAKRPVFIFEWLRFLDKVLVAAQKVINLKESDSFSKYSLFPYICYVCNFAYAFVRIFRRTSKDVRRNWWHSY